MGSEALVHQTKRDDWMTPQSIIDLVRRMRRFVCDPCAPRNPDDWFADCNWNLNPHDGLKEDWSLVPGIVYMNPPYGGRRGVINEWIDKAVSEAARGTEIVGLVAASTGAQWFKRIWRSANAICFVEGRLRFRIPNSPGVDVGAGSATFWSAIPYWGPAPARFISIFNDAGVSIELGSRPSAATVDGRVLGSEV